MTVTAYIKASNSWRTAGDRRWSVGLLLVHLVPFEGRVDSQPLALRVRARQNSVVCSKSAG